MRIILSLAAFAVCAAAAPALADVKTACAGDVKSYCSGIEAKGGKLRDCMAENRAKLSTSCKIAVAERLLDKQAKQAQDRKTGKKSSKDDDDE